MNPTLKFLKAQGLKLSLPLLLLTTACGDGTPSASQGDVATVDPDPIAQAAQPSVGFGTTPAGNSAGLPTPAVSLPANTGGTGSLSNALPPASTNAGTSSAAVPSAGATAVPEPAALLGLAIAAAGMVTLKRKQSA